MHLSSQFLNNEGQLGSEGAVMGFRYPISLWGTNVFRGNKGGGISLLQTELQAHGYILFENNVAQNGGGMELKDRSRVRKKTSSKQF